MHKTVFIASLAATCVVFSLLWGIGPAHAISFIQSSTGPGNTTYGKCNTDSLTSRSWTNDMSCTAFEVTSSINITHGWWYTEMSSGQSPVDFQLLIYSNSGGDPGSGGAPSSLEGDCSSATSIPSNGNVGWTEVTWSTPVSLSSGWYWACYYTEGNHEQYYVNAVGNEYGEADISWTSTCGDETPDDGSGTITNAICLGNYDAK